MSTESSYSAIIKTVRLYVEGMCQADAGKLRLAMHPKACVIGHFDGGLEWEDTEAFIATVRDAVERPDPDPWFRIKSVSRIGDIAHVLVEDYWLGDRYDDMLTLLHHDSEWIIVSKVFYYHPT